MPIAVRFSALALFNSSGNVAWIRVNPNKGKHSIHTFTMQKFIKVLHGIQPVSVD